MQLQVRVDSGLEINLVISKLTYRLQEQRTLWQADNRLAGR